MKFAVIGSGFTGLACGLELAKSGHEVTIFEKTVLDNKIPIEKVKKGDKFEIDNIYFSILFPDPNFKYNKTSMPEMVLNISYSTTSILLLGDVSKTIQKSFISEINKVDIIEYAHGAGDSRTSFDLFDKVDPEFVIISKQINSTPFKRRNNAEIINLKEKGTRKFSF